MNVGTLVRVIRKDYQWNPSLRRRSGQIGVIVKELPTHGHSPDEYEVLFWDEEIETLTSCTLEKL